MSAAIIRRETTSRRPVYYADPDGRLGFATYIAGRWYARNHHRGYRLENRRSKNPRLVGLNGKVVIPVRIVPDYVEPDGEIF